MQFLKFASGLSLVMEEAQDQKVCVWEWLMVNDNEIQQAIAN